MANAAKVREVIEHIDAQLAARKDVVFHMSSWRVWLNARELRQMRPELTSDPVIAALAPEAETCGTSMCFAGWAVDYDDPGKSYENHEDWRYANHAARLMGLDADEQRIFYEEGIADTQVLRAACNAYFHEEIFSLAECGGHSWYTREFEDVTGHASVDVPF